MGSVVSTLVDKVAQLEHNTGAVMAEVLRENRALRAENARLSTQSISSEVTTQLGGTSASLPSITPGFHPAFQSHTPKWAPPFFYAPRLCIFIYVLCHAPK